MRARLWRGDTGPPPAAAVLPLTAAGVGLLAAGLPLTLPSSMGLGSGVAVVLLLALAAGLCVARDVGRTWCVVALVLWVALRLVPGEGPVVAVAIGSGVLIRLLAGLPELARLGRAAVRDLTGEVLGGASAAGLVVAVSRGGDALPATALIGAAVAGLLLSATAVLRIKR